MLTKPVVILFILYLHLSVRVNGEELVMRAWQCTLGYQNHSTYTQQL